MRSFPPSLQTETQVSSLCEHPGNPVSVLQAGMIRTDSDEYFIEPLERGAQELEDHGRVHVVYRRSALLKPPSDISVDYQLQGRTMIVMGPGSSSQGVNTSTHAMYLTTLHFLLPVGWLECDFCLCVNWGVLADCLEFFTPFWDPPKVTPKVINVVGNRQPSE